MTLPSGQLRLTVALIASAIALLGAVNTGAAHQKSPPFASHAELTNWIGTYRRAPDPRSLPRAVHAMARLGLFADHEKAAFFIGFSAGVLGDNPEYARDLIAAMFPMPPENQAVIIKSIAYSGLADWKDILIAVTERMPLRTVLIRRYLYDNGKTLFEVPLAGNPAVIDSLWGYYFATGRIEPIRRMLEALKWARQKRDLDKITVAGMAEWTLASNAARDPELLTRLKTEIDRHPAKIVGPLREIIVAVELYNWKGIREAAVARIDAAKQRQAARTSSPLGGMGWLGQTGATAISVACVIANATGHPEIAAPCIITGALYTGAMRLLSSMP